MNPLPTANSTSRGPGASTPPLECWTGLPGFDRYDKIYRMDNAEKMLSRMAAELRPSPTLAIDAKAKALKAQGVDVISLSVGEPDFDTPLHIKEAAVAAIQAGFTKYTPASGIPDLKSAIARQFKATQGLEFEPGQVVVGCGAKHVIANAIAALVNEGDEVLIPAPFWVSYPVMARLAGGIPKIVYPDGEVRTWDPDSAHLPPPAAGFRLKPEILAKGLTAKTKLVIMNSPSNPTGEVYSEEEVKALANVLKGHSAYIISDEIYDALVYDGKARSLSAVEPALKERTIVVNGVSKAFAMTGWRIGWAAGPKKIIDAIGNIQSQTTSNPTSIAQKAALAALTGSMDCVEKMRVEFGQRRDIMVDGMRKMPGIVCAKPGGAFYVFPDVRHIADNHAARAKLKMEGVHGFSQALCSYLLDEAKVACVPGAEFGYECHLRFSYAASRETLVKAIERVSVALASLQQG